MAGQPAPSTRGSISFRFGICDITNIQGEFIDVSKMTAQLCGYPCHEKMLGTTLFDIQCQAVENSPSFYKQNKLALSIHSRSALIEGKNVPGN